MLFQRTVSGAILIAIVIPLVFQGGPLYLAAIIALALLCGWEYGHMLAGAGHKPFYAVIYALGALLPLLAYWRWPFPTLSDAVAIITLLSLAAQVLRPGLRNSLANWSLSLAGGLYISLLLSYFIFLRNLDKGEFWVLLSLFCTWACDSVAYLVGITFGRHGFFTGISPKKTLEGAIGGIMAGSVTAFLGLPMLGIPAAHALPLGLAISIAATLGDLAESLIKRQLKVKDSGHLIPGHGGFLDRVDSLLFAAVVTYLYAVWWTK